MKTLKKISSLVIISTLIFLAACKKEKEETPVPSTPAPTSNDIATKIVGNYSGNGTSSSGSSFTNKVIRITKVSDTRVKVESVSHSNITTFEINIMQVGTAVTGDANATNDFAVQMATSPYTIAFETYSPDQDFGGSKQ